MNKIKQIYDSLLKSYGRQGWWPIIPTGGCCGNINEPIYGVSIKNDNHRFEIVIGAILTQNTSWKNVTKAIIELNKKKLINVDKILKVETDRLATVIKSAGYFNQKAKKLKNAALFIKENSFEKLLKLDTEECRKLLLSVNGIGPETADSILVYALNKPSFVVDAYTKRFLISLGMINENASYDKIQDIFMQNLNHDYKLFNEYHALLVEHGKRFYSKKPYGKDDPIIKK